jgi:hypothetical protein
MWTVNLEHSVTKLHINVGNPEIRVTGTDFLLTKHRSIDPVQRGSHGDRENTKNDVIARAAAKSNQLPITDP